VSKKCCPEDYYKHSPPDNTLRGCFEVIDNSKIVKKKKTLNNMLVPLGNKFHICDTNNTERVRDFLLNPDSRWDWYHNDPEFNMHIFENDLYFHNCDYRPFKPYKRKTNEEYIQYNIKLKEKIKADPKLKKKFRVYQGVKGNWPLTELSYSNIETDINWGPMHALSNVGCNIIENWKGERINYKNSGGKGKCIEYCKLTGTHPILYSGINSIDPNDNQKFKLDSKHIKWEISKILQHKVCTYRFYLNINFKRRKMYLLFIEIILD
jgi:hypothetical protein